MKHSELVKNNFEIKYKDYDSLIRSLIPKYEEMHKIALHQIKFSNKKDLRILDLGIGTGQTALKILESFPKATIDGVDLSKNMISQSKIRLKKYSSRVKFFESDILDFKLTKKYDVVISVLCIHHLNSKQKEKFFKKIHGALNKEGIFIIADIVKFNSKKETKQRELEWKKFIAKNLGEIKADYWFNNYLEEDLPDSINMQLKWLKEAGFSKAECSWNHMNYSVFYGIK